MTKKPSASTFPNIITIIAAVILIAVLLIQSNDRVKEQTATIDALNAQLAAQTEA